MAFSLTWLPDVLINAGLKVALSPGWESRGHGEMSEVRGVICHHTATPGKNSGNMPTLKTLIVGRPDLSGPLAQLGLGRDGTYYIVAAGRCFHAGAGEWQGTTSGNSHFIGIEAENTGGHDDTPWPAIQLEAYHRGVAAILNHIGKDASSCAGHKEYALPKGRKSDPDFDMDTFRVAVTDILNGTAPAPALIPSVTPATASKPARATLRRGLDNNPELVKIVQTRLGLTADGNLGPKTEAAIRAFQKAHDMVPDGIVGPKTWQAIAP
ncbi:peptidoglycan recognition protein family protein [Mucilaginibacter xinganensis]|uniref:Peptidoglycan-binding protein n=1 Tax=Mucilaginibacter xinganensis TaxID=1234841 RepID=A0A223NY45_9SPHI|nr:N-acetylmuramoyl-L-alanine amidase [Mucilaginibacter xinganensis]ASU34785.1 peptidoglycan-binding protein [Mucilaginibacter xinganensis]